MTPRSAGAALTLGALGVVFGDIGTSPLYAMKETFSGAHELAPDRGSVYGVLSLIFWAITIVVSVKYVLFVMRADNDGEGGIMALISLVQHVAEDERVHVDNLRYKDDGISLLEARFGFQDDPDVPATLRLAAGKGLEGDVHDPAYFLSRISILPKRGEDMAMWRKRLFAYMSRNAASPVRYFNLPEERVISMGTTIVL